MKVFRRRVSGGSPSLDDVPDLEPEPGKSCFKSTGRKGLSVQFADEARCVVSGAVVPPHPRDRVQWAIEAFAKAPLTIRNLKRARWFSFQWLFPNLHPANDENPWDWYVDRQEHEQEAEIERLLDCADSNSLHNRADCPINNPRDRINHPRLKNQPPRFIPAKRRAK
ncbi:hypothetical protein C8A00DRAFT_14864 [Chaetomidium leptoderma]|uniref:Uncharacterized protein n=1 Tax=Chaetomidium leptoderma TaxID=669021 RepID=A0AAN6VMD8_9PEZI|nr:hypothetical protein C8A00DRAFT_14864 [Chaetomidium leptoderma]